MGLGGATCRLSISIPADPIMDAGRVPANAPISFPAPICLADFRDMVCDECIRTP